MTIITDTLDVIKTEGDDLNVFVQLFCLVTAVTHDLNQQLARRGLTPQDAAAILSAAAQDSQTHPETPNQPDVPPFAPFTDFDNFAVPPFAVIDETDALAEAQSVIDGQDLGQIQTLLREQNRIADTLHQAAALIEETQRHTRHTPQIPQGQALDSRIHSGIPKSTATRVRAILDQGPLFLDYETTGLRRGVQVKELPSPESGEGPGVRVYPTTATAKYHQVVEIAVLDGAGRNIFHSLVNPQRDIPATVTRTHGLDQAAVATAPTWAEIAPLLKRVLAGRTVIAHNAKFESLFTPGEWDITWECTKQLADEAFGKYGHGHMDAQYDWRKSGSLSNRLRQCGLTPAPQHTAAGDCLSTIRLARYLAGLEQIC